MQAELKAGESVRIEAYAKADTDAGGTYEICLGSVVMTEVEQMLTAGGLTTTYEMGNYHYYQQAGVISGTNPTRNEPYVSLVNRWSFDWLDATQDEDNPVITPCKYYNGSYNRAIANAGSGLRASYQYSPGTGADSGMKLEMNAVGYGASMSFAVPQDGYATLNAKKKAVDTCLVRVLKTDGATGAVTTVFPVGGGWYSDTSSSFTASCGAVGKGDVLTLQYLAKNGLSTFSITPSVTITDRAASTDDTKFAALLERPYDGMEYEGDYVKPAASVWNFNLLQGGENASGAAVLTVVEPDRFSSGKDAFLYHSSNGQAGYHFGESELTFDLAGTTEASASGAKTGMGLSLEFTCPLTGYYDFSTALRLLEGSGTIQYRVQRQSGTTTQAVTPESGWATLAAGQEIPSMEISASGGDIIKLQVYAVSAENDGDIVTVGLASPTFYRLGGTAAVKDGYQSIIEAVKYVPCVDPGYEGDYFEMDKRINYDILDRDGNTSHANWVVNTGGTLVLTDKDDREGPGYEFTEDGMRVRLTQGAGVSIQYDSTKAGRVTLGISAPGSLPAGIQYRVLLDGREVTGWTAFTADGVRFGEDSALLEIEEGNQLTVQFKAASRVTLDLTGGFTLMVLGEHKGGNAVGDTIFYAITAGPYQKDDYIGEYVPQEDNEQRVWNFYAMPSDTFGQTDVDYYDSSNNRFLYHRESGTGVHFSDNGKGFLMTLKEEEGKTPVGVSVDFTVPESNSYYIQPDLILEAIEESGTAVPLEATIHFRVMCGDTVVWPTQGTEGEQDGWFVQAMQGGDSKAVPLIEIEASEGQHIRLDAYATDIRRDGEPCDTLQLSLGYPTPVIRVTPVTAYISTDVSARVYAALDFHPFANLDTGGEVVYRALPSHWNFEGFSLNTADGTLETYSYTKYNSKQDYYLFGDGNSSGYHIRSGINSELRPAADGAAHGTSMKFVSPLSGDIRIYGAPSILNAQTYKSDTFGIYFRVVKNRGTEGEEVLWPADGTWERLSKSQTASRFQGLSLTVEQGDTIEYQLYAAEPEGTEALDRTYTVANGGPSAVIIDDMTTDKDLFNVVTDFTRTYQLSPFWKYEYALDANAQTPDYQPLTSFNASWENYWLTAVGNNHWLGVNAGKLWIYNKETEEQPHGLACYTFTAPKDGYFSLTSGSVSTQNPEGARVRITRNGEVVWPASGNWQTFETSTTVSMDTIRINQGDVIRFEASLNGDSPSTWNGSRVSWSPRFTLTVNNPAYNTIDSIYYGLDEEMLAYFQKLDSTVQFDMDYDANQDKANSSQDDGDDEPAVPTTPPSDNVPDIPPADSGQEEPDTSPTDTGEDPGGDTTETSRRKKTTVTYITIVGLPTWAIILIVVGGVLVVGGAAALIILKVRKRKRQQPGEVSGEPASSGNPPSDKQKEE